MRFLLSTTATRWRRRQGQAMAARRLHLPRSTDCLHDRGPPRQRQPRRRPGRGRGAAATVRCRDADPAIGGNVEALEPSPPVREVSAVVGGKSPFVVSGFPADSAVSGPRLRLSRSTARSPDFLKDTRTGRGGFDSEMGADASGEGSGSSCSGLESLVPAPVISPRTSQTTRSHSGRSWVSGPSFELRGSPSSGVDEIDELVQPRSLGRLTYGREDPT